MLTGEKLNMTRASLIRPRHLRLYATVVCAALCVCVCVSVCVRGAGLATLRRWRWRVRR